MNAKENSFVVYVKAGRSLHDAAELAGYARPHRAAARLAKRLAEQLAPAQEPTDLDPSTRLERTLQRLDLIVSRGDDRDAVSAARPLLEECRKLVEQAANPALQVRLDSGMGPLPEPGPHCYHVVCSDVSSLEDAAELIMEAISGR